jgi:hypothetical protein
LKWNDCGKVEEIEDVASIDPYQVEMVLADMEVQLFFLCVHEIGQQAEVVLTEVDVP